MKLKDELGEAVANCTLALTIDSKNVKALYRRGQVTLPTARHSPLPHCLFLALSSSQVYLLKGDLQLAKADLLKAQSIEPSNTDVSQAFHHLNRKFIWVYEQSYGQVRLLLMIAVAQSHLQ